MGEVECDMAHTPPHCDTNRKSRSINDRDIGDGRVKEGGHHSTSKEDQGAAHGTPAAGPAVGPRRGIPSFALHPPVLLLPVQRQRADWRKLMLAKAQRGKLMVFKAN